MRAVVITEPGRAPVAEEFPEPQLGPADMLLDLVGAGVHPIVRGLASGRHYGSDGAFPQVAGVDAVARDDRGRLVYTGWASAPWGTMADRMATPFGLPLPDGADPLAVAAGMNPGLAGWLPLVQRHAELGSLGTVVVLGATGASGRMAVGEAFALGARRVVAAGRDATALAALAERGASVVDLTGDDPAGALADRIAGQGPDLVLDFVWGPVAEACFDALSRRGRGDDDADIAYVQIGTMAGPAATVPGALLRSRRITLRGSGLGSTPRSRVIAELPRVMAMIADGTLPVPYTAYPLGRAAEAFAHTGPGRAVVVPD